MIDPTELGRKIRERREAAGLSRRHLAADIGVSESHIAKTENGRFRPSLDTLRRISRRLGIAMPELIGESDPASDEIDVVTLALALEAAMRIMWRRSVSEEGRATWELAAALYAFIREETREGHLIDNVDQLVRLAQRMQSLPFRRR